MLYDLVLWGFLCLLRVFHCVRFARMSDKAEARKKAEQKRELEDKLFYDDGSYLLDKEEKLVAGWMKSMLDKELV